MSGRRAYPVNYEGITELPLKTVVEGPEAYVHNLEILFASYPELGQSLSLKSLVPFSGGLPFYNLQAFFGISSTGTPWHCANNFNFFFQLQGEKHWEFADPRFSFCFAPAWMAKPTAFKPDLRVCGEEMPFTEVLAAYCPLFNAVPRLVTILKPGDVMLNPPFWWHAIRNVCSAQDGFVVGVSTRWGEPILLWDNFSNVLFSALQKLSPAMLGFYFAQFVGMFGNVLLSQHRGMDTTYTTPIAGRFTTFEFGSHFPTAPDGRSVSAALM
mmetsp:Transcript_28234/g.92142  ORF Transcript_28234/g.92142 Transcript_28234/m.92142 type:complete len:269 (+) Transcript_28234:737-1543(+)